MVEHEKYSWETCWCKLLWSRCHCHLVSVTFWWNSRKLSDGHSKLALDVIALICLQTAWSEKTNTRLYYEPGKGVHSSCNSWLLQLLAALKKGKKKALERILAVNGFPKNFPSHSYGTSLAIWDHTVLPATRHKWTRPASTPSSKLVLDLPTPQGWKAELTYATRQCTSRKLNSQSVDITSPTPYHYTTSHFALFFYL